MSIAECIYGLYDRAAEREQAIQGLQARILPILPRRIFRVESSNYMMIVQAADSLSAEAMIRPAIGPTIFVNVTELTSEGSAIFYERNV